MKWEIYKRMTEDQRLEWDHKFGNKALPKISIWSIVALWAVISYFMLTIFIILKEYIDFKSDVLNLLVGLRKITMIFVIIYCLQYSVMWTLFFINKYKEKKWVDQLFKK